MMGAGSGERENREEPGTDETQAPVVTASVSCAAAVDWDGLRAAARQVMGQAYAPYSRFPVGAAALVDDGRIVVGCNVENASYGVGLCAECGLVSALRSSGGGRLVAFTCVGPDGELLMPCGRCRQLLWEFGGATLLVETARGIVPMSEVLPDAFGPDDLSRAI
jgi:cytidine deaminase